jgi:hypothetical protein
VNFLSILAAIGRLAVGVLLLIYVWQEPGTQMAEIGVALLLFHSASHTSPRSERDPA